MSIYWIYNYGEKWYITKQDTRTHIEEVFCLKKITVMLLIVFAVGCVALTGCGDVNVNTNVNVTVNN